MGSREETRRLPLRRVSSREPIFLRARVRVYYAGIAKVRDNSQSRWGDNVEYKFLKTEPVSPTTFQQWVLALSWLLSSWHSLI